MVSEGPGAGVLSAVSGLSLGFSSGAFGVLQRERERSRRIVLTRLCTALIQHKQSVVVLGWVFDGWLELVVDG